MYWQKCFRGQVYSLDPAGELKCCPRYASCGREESKGRKDRKGEGRGTCGDH